MIGLKKFREKRPFGKDKLYNDSEFLGYLTNGILLQELSAQKKFLCTSCDGVLSITADSCVHCGETEFYWSIDRNVDSFLQSLQVCTKEKWSVEDHIEKANSLADNLFVLLLRIFLKYPIYYYDIHQSYDLHSRNLKTLGSHSLFKQYHIYSDPNIESNLIRPDNIKSIVSHIISSIKTTVEEKSPFLFPFYLLESCYHYEQLIVTMIDNLDRNFSKWPYFIRIFKFYINRRKNMILMHIFLDHLIASAEDALKCFNFSKNSSYKSSNSFPIKILESFLDECKSEKLYIDKELKKEGKKITQAVKKSIPRL